MGAHQQKFLPQYNVYHRKTVLVPVPTPVLLGVYTTFERRQNKKKPLRKLETVQLIRYMNFDISCECVLVSTMINYYSLMYTQNKMNILSILKLITHKIKVEGEGA